MLRDQSQSGGMGAEKHTLTEIAGSLKHSCAGQLRKRVNLRDYAGQVGIVLQ